MPNGDRRDPIGMVQKTAGRAGHCFGCRQNRSRKHLQHRRGRGLGLSRLRIQGVNSNNN